MKIDTEKVKSYVAIADKSIKDSKGLGDLISRVMQGLVAKYIGN